MRPPTPARLRPGLSLPGVAVSLLLAITFCLFPMIGCGQLDTEDLIRPILTEARLAADPTRPWEQAEVTLALRLEAGWNVQEQTARLEYARLFQGSTWRTNEPAVELALRLPEGAELPFEAGEVRAVVLEGYNPNDLFSPFCGETLRLLVAIRTSGAHSLLGVSQDVEVGCGGAIQ